MISSYPRVRHPSIPLQLQQPGDINADSSGRYRPARCRNPSRTGRSLTGLGSCIKPAHPGEFHSRIRNLSIPLQLRQPGDESGDPPGRNRPARCGNPSPTGRSLLAGDRREPARPGEDQFPSPGQKSVHMSTAPTTRGRKRRSPGSIPSRSVWKPQPHWVITDWLGLMEPARGESCPSGQRQGPAAPGEDNFTSPGHQ